MFKAIWNEKIIAESDQTIEIEGNQYFPRDSVKAEYLKPSEMKTICPWKGDCSYYNIEVDGQANADAAWYYPEPKEAASKIKDYIAFWRGVKVVRG